MNTSVFAAPLLGGVIIGLAAALLWLGTGRVFGVSGVLAGSLTTKSGDRAWRVAALLGLVAAGIVLLLLYPSAFPAQVDGPLWRYALAGLLVGYGTRLGGGCTSGHGVCGISRGSWRSVVATLVFMVAGMLAVVVCRSLGAL